MAEAVRTFYEILHVGPEASPGQISDAFRKLVREHHPDRFKDPVAKAEAEALLKAVTEAYNTLSKPGLRQEYDQSLARPASAVVQKSPQEMVRELIQTGLARDKAGDPESALASFDHAIRLDPSSDLALYHAGMIRVRSARMRLQGTQQVEKAIELNPFNSRYVKDYAHFLIENNQQHRAQRLLEDGLRSNPNDASLSVLLDQVKGQEKASGFSLFRKK